MRLVCPWRRLWVWLVAPRDSERKRLVEQGLNLKLANRQIQVPGIEPETFSVLG